MRQPSQPAGHPNLISSIRCPHCGSTATLPLPGLGDRLGAIYATFARRSADLSFDNPDLVRKFNAGEISACCRHCHKSFSHKAARPEARPAPLVRARVQVERLRELDRMRGEGLISETEFQSKRSQIINEF